MGCGSSKWDGDKTDYMTLQCRLGRIEAAPKKVVAYKGGKKAGKESKKTA